MVRRLVNGGNQRQTARAAGGIVAAGYRITYSVLEGPLPVKKIVTTMHLRPITDSTARWVNGPHNSKPSLGKEEESAQFMSRVFGAGFRALKKHLGV